MQIFSILILALLLLTGCASNPKDPTEIPVEYEQESYYLDYDIGGFHYVKMN